ncbi:MAG: flagellar export chaperone FliS [Clostridiales bacterium]|nr:flagellar export chaperone FliS [Clostridiales bacterium]
MNMNGYQQYKQQSVGTMTSGEMLILLFDGAIRNITAADIAIDKQDYEQMNISIEKTEKIIRYLSNTLDMKYSISRDLYRLYDYFLYQLTRLKAGRNREIAKELKTMLFDLRNTFKEADKIASNQATAAK